MLQYGTVQYSTVDGDKFAVSSVSPLNPPVSQTVSVSCACGAIFNTIPYSLVVIGSFYIFMNIIFSHLHSNFLYVKFKSLVLHCSRLQ